MLLQVSSLFVYPVKSLGGISLPVVNVTTRGFEHDRHMMLTDEYGRFLTQREWPRLCLFSTSLHQNGIFIIHKNEKVFIPFYFDGHEMTVQVWEDTVTAIRASDEINRWFSARVGFSCSLVRCASQTKRMVDTTYAKHNEQTAFADAFPVLILGQESLNLLNSKLQDKLPADRFRPNMVFSGGLPHQEDECKLMYIADTILELSKPCTRCTIPTINQQTSKKGKEPLHTLGIYRQQNNKILFGQNALVLSPGVIKVGDVVHVS
jgi:uncharacterized protein YcbX